MVKLQEESFALRCLTLCAHDEAKLEDVFRKNSAALEQLQQKLGSSHQEGHFLLQTTSICCTWLRRLGRNSLETWQTSDRLPMIGRLRKQRVFDFATFPILEASDDVSIEMLMLCLWLSEGLFTVWLAFDNRLLIGILTMPVFCMYITNDNLSTCTVRYLTRYMGG